VGLAPVETVLLLLRYRQRGDLGVVLKAERGLRRSMTGVVFAEGAVPHVVQDVFDAPVASDPGGELGRGGVEDVHAEVDAPVGQFPGAQVAAPAHDLDRLAGAGTADVAEHGDLEPTDLVAVVDLVAGVVVEWLQRALGFALDPESGAVRRPCAGRA
jgi:hypothetical protein